MEDAIPAAGLCLACAAILAALYFVLEPSEVVSIWKGLKTEGRTLYAVIVGDEEFLKSRSQAAIRKAGGR
jgi:hypothetical protein